MIPVVTNSVLINATGSESIALTGSGSHTYVTAEISVIHVAGASPITAVKWNAVNLVLLVAATEYTAFVEIWGWNFANGACPTGAHSVVITSDTGTNGFATAAYWSEVDQTTPVAHIASYTSQYAISPHNLAIATEAGNYSLDTVLVVAIGGPVTNLALQNSATPIATMETWWGVAGSSYKQTAPQLGWAFTTSYTYQYAQAAVSLKPFSTASYPDAPVGAATATPGDGFAFVDWTSGSDGGSPLTTPKYTATSTPGGFFGESDTKPVPVLGLSNGTPYTFKGKDHNLFGYGPESTASGAVTPAITSSFGWFVDSNVNM